MSEVLWMSYNLDRLRPVKFEMIIPQRPHSDKISLIVVRAN